MIEDESRGFAWTNAVLGLRANEIHLCGDERAFKLISKLTEITGDIVICSNIILLVTLACL